MGSFKHKSIVNKLKRLGADPADIQETVNQNSINYQINIGSQVITWYTPSHSPDEGHLLHIRREDDHSDMMTDYHAGSFIDRLGWLENWIKDEDWQRYQAEKQAEDQASQESSGEPETAPETAVEPEDQPEDQESEAAPASKTFPKQIELTRVEGQTKDLATITITGGPGVDVMAQSDYILWGWGGSVELGVVKVDGKITFADGSERLFTCAVGKADVGKHRIIQERQGLWIEDAPSLDISEPDLNSFTAI